MVPFTEEILNGKLHLSVKWGATLKVTKKKLSRARITIRIISNNKTKNQDKACFC